VRRDRSPERMATMQTFAEEPSASDPLAGKLVPAAPEMLFRYPQSLTPELHGRFVVVTGGSSGIGRSLASQFAAAGASVLVASRREAHNDLEHRYLDLACFASVAEFAGGLLREGRPIDCLILNAGVHLPWKRVVTGDGEELHWQVNYLSNFLLSHLLLDLCRRSTLRRLVYVSSEAHRLAAIPGAALLGFWHLYAKSKEAATAYFIRFQELHPDLVARVVSPGFVDTEIHLAKSAVANWLERTRVRPRTADAAAREIFNTCMECSGSGSVYWDRGSPATPGRHCLDAEYAESLWQASVASLRNLLPHASAHERVFNYAGTWQAFGPAVVRPSTVEELATTVRQAAEQGRSIRVVGQRHSYNDCFFSRSCMVSVENLNRVLAFDPERGTITCQGGISVEALCNFLDHHGYALRYCGNHGKQTIAGALATGTHGYGREGGVMSELVLAVTLMLPDGGLVEVSDERDLGALRLSLGALGITVAVTLAVEKAVPCLYEVASMARQAFTDRFDELARQNEYLRFVPHPFDARSVLYVTINRATDATMTQRAEYIGAFAGGPWRILVPLFRMPPVRTAIGRAFALERHKLSVHVPFSAMLFVRAGIAQQYRGLVTVAQFALDRPDWLNTELAIPRERYAEFERLFAERRPHISRLASGQPYYTCRVVGAARNVLLAPNYDRDVVFVDIHADKLHPLSRAFLRGLEEAAVSDLSARPHWGKLFFSDRGTLRTLYPRENLAAYSATKERYDPESVFSNDYTRRVLGV
jgi:L-gulono-1,4-lactone dehydrogenase